MDKYTVERVLGEGRFGRASLCTDLSSGKKVVVKTLNKGVGTKQLKLFEKEVDTMCLISHPNIIKYIDSFEDSENSCVVMEYLEGQNLEQFLANGHMDELVGVKILYQLLHALNTVHSKKIVHKDIKPENIIFDLKGNVKLADFGIAKILEYGGDMESIAAYTPDYSAPELINGKYDTKYDIFSAGVLAYQILVGCLPFDTQEQRISGQFKPFPNTLDPFLKETITKMLSTNPRKRPTTEKIISIMEKEYGEIKNGMKWKVDGKKLIISGLGPIPDCSEGAPWGKNQSTIQTVIVKRGVKRIGDFAFYNFRQMKQVELHQSLLSIGMSAFENCTKLKTISIPDSVFEIGMSAFEHCIHLNLVILPNSLDTIRSWSFHKCSRLKKINLEKIKTAGEGAFSDTPIKFIKTKFIKEDVESLLDVGKKFVGKNKKRVASIFDRVFKTSKEYSEKGAFEAMYLLGTCYEEGIGTEKNIEIAYFYRQLSQSIKNPTALDQLCLIMPKMESLDEESCLKVMGDSGSAEAVYQMGMRLNDKKKKEAFIHFQRAAEMGHMKALRQVVLNCKGGIGSKNIKNRALKQLEIASKEGNAETLYQLGLMYKVENAVEAFEHFKRAVEGGHYNAIFELAMCYEEGRGVSSSLAEAVRLNRYAADGGDLRGMLGLLRCLSRGFKMTNLERTELSVCISQKVIEQLGEAEWKQEGDLEWTFNVIQGQLIIKGKGSLDSYIEGRKKCIMKDNVDERVPWRKYSTQIKTVYICHGIASIGSNAFYECNNLSTLVIPSTVTSIGSYAFYKCNSLTTVAMAEGVIEIGKFAFSNCKMLKAAAIPASVISIGEDAFYNCRVLTKAILPEGISEIKVETFKDCVKLKIVKIPETVTKICKRAFNCCNSLVDITIPASVNSIASNPFSNCQQLQSIIVDVNNQYFASIDGVLFNKSISHLIACPCTKWDYVIPSSVTSIGELAFFHCKILDSVVIPSSVSSIEHNAFCGCTALKSVTIPFGVTSISYGLFSECTSLETVVIPASVTEIENYAFEDCSSLSSIAIPTSVTSIGEESFNHCKNLKHVFLPEHLAGQESKFPRSAYVRIR